MNPLNAWRLAAALALAGTGLALSQSWPMEMVTHTEFGMPEQHVFVESPDDPDRVVRVDVDQAQQPEFQDIELYTSPDTSMASEAGEFPRGTPLGLTLGAWLAASGSGTYTVDGDMARLELTFENLIPFGLYSTWCGRLHLEGGEIVGMTDLPCGAADGSDSPFVADREGRAHVTMDLTPWPPSTETDVQDFAITFHSDGRAYGPSPGAFGANSHVQLFVSLDTPLP
jgi:hypothetical protein